MRIAYADPPYLGLCSFYDHTHPDGLCWDDPGTHRLLLERLRDEFTDGWALSLHAPAIDEYAHLLRAATITGHRWAAWVKPFASFKKGVNPAFAWEPILWAGGRKGSLRGGGDTCRDWCAVPITLRRGFKGAKPEAMCFWLFDLLGLRPADDFVDLYSGSGAVQRAWDRYRRASRHNISGALFPDTSLLPSAPAADPTSTP